MNLPTDGLFFTPLVGKFCILKGWPDIALTYREAINEYASRCTGFGLNHKLSNTASIDADNIELTKNFFHERGASWEEVYGEQFRITSPKDTSDKVIFTIPPGVELDHLTFSDAQSGEQFLEFRTGSHQDAWPGSAYIFPDQGWDDWEKDKKRYGHSGSTTIKEMPQFLVDIWLKELANTNRPKGSSSKIQVSKNSKKVGQTTADLVEIMLTGVPGLFTAIRDYSFGLVADGVLESQVTQTIQTMLGHCRDQERGKQYYDDVPRLVGGVKAYLGWANAKAIIPKTEEVIEGPELDWPPGLMGELAKSAYNAQKFQNRTVATITALATVAGIVGRRFNISETGLNIYLTLLARTGSGKDAIDTFIDMVYESLGVHDVFKGDRRFTGPKALILPLAARGCFVSVFTEAGILFRSGAGDNEGLLRTILNLYSRSGQGSMLSGENYSKQDDSLPTLFSPALSLVNEATPETFITELKKRQSIDTGELPRMHVTRLFEDRPYENRNARFDIPPEVAQRLFYLSNFCSQTQTDQDSDPIHIKVPEKHWDFTDYCTDQVNKYLHSDPLKSGMFSRAALKNLRICGLLAAFDHLSKKAEPEVTSAYWDWAISFHEYEMAGMSSLFHGESDLELVAKDVVGNTIAKILAGKIQGRSAPNGSMRRAGQFTYSNISQALKNSKRVREMDDPPIRNNPKTGLEKSLAFLERIGYLFRPERIAGGRPRNVKSVYQVTEDFRLYFSGE